MKGEKSYLVPTTRSKNDWICMSPRNCFSIALRIESWIIPRIPPLLGLVSIITTRHQEAHWQASSEGRGLPIQTQYANTCTFWLFVNQYTTIGIRQGVERTACCATCIG